MDEEQNSKNSHVGPDEAGFLHSVMRVVPEPTLKRAVYALFIVIFLTSLCALIGLFKALVYPGGIFLAGQLKFGFDYGSANEKKIIAEGVVDIGETRIQWGTFVTKDVWTRVEFRAPFKDENVSVSASTSEEPTYYYSVQMRNIGRYGFEMGYLSMEWDPVFTQLRVRGGQPPLTEEDMKAIGSTRMDKDLVGWAFHLTDLKCNYIAIGRKP